METLLNAIVGFGEPGMSKINGNFETDSVGVKEISLTKM